MKCATKFFYVFDVFLSLTEFSCRVCVKAGQGDSCEYFVALEIKISIIDKIEVEGEQAQFCTSVAEEIYLMF